MAKTRIQKKEALDTLKDKMSKMKSAVFVNFSGISVKKIDELRNSCKQENVQYIVTKKTLLKKALVERGLEEAENGTFEGEVATVIGFEDEVAPARLVSEFAKENKSMNIIGGILEGSMIDPSKVNALAQLSSRQELLASAVGSIAAPLSGIVNVLQGNIRKFVYVLSAIGEKKE